MAPTSARTARLVERQRLYQLIRQQGAVRDHTFEIEFLDPGVQRTRLRSAEETDMRLQRLRFRFAAVALTALVGVGRLRASGGRRLRNSRHPRSTRRRRACGYRDRRLRRGLLLGRPGRVPARSGRAQRRVGLRRRRISANAHYEIVGSGTTGHAETVQITYDPSKVTYGKLLQVFFLRGARPDAVQHAGSRSRHAIPVDDLSGGRKATRDRRGVHRAARPTHVYEGTS